VAVPAAYHDALTRAVETDTVYSRVFDKGWEDAPHRALRNSTLESWEKAGRPPKGERPGERDVVARFADGGPGERYSDVHPVDRMTGEFEALALYTGQGVGLVLGVLSAREIVRGTG
jgi:nitronate monooxygenase